MRWKSENIAYCSNVHPCATAGEVFDVVDTDIRSVRERRGLDQLYAGLWLPNTVVVELLKDDVAFRSFAARLDAANIRVVSTNGFPYGNFHDRVVKEKVYSPDWAQSARVAYTRALATLMARLLPEECHAGTLSTLPLGFQPQWNVGRHQKALENLVDIASWLADLEQSTGRRIKICLEMEPGCVIETTSRMVQLFSDELPNVSAARGVAEDTVRKYLAVCFDVCHQAVMFEDVYDALSEFRKNEICVGKIQLSSALTVLDPARPEVRGKLKRFSEDRYLHQVRTRVGNEIHGKMDLAEALTDAAFPRNSSWRVHFHVPVMLDRVEEYSLGTTRRSLLRALDFLSDNDDFAPHLEVETYTWGVIPGASHPRDREDLQAKLASELEWVEEQMSVRKLLAGL